MTPQETATRTTLSEQWKEAQRRLDWMHVPNAPNWINKLVSGKDLPAGHWAHYACERHVRPLLERRLQQDPSIRGLSMVSLGCGSAHIEELYAILPENLKYDLRWPEPQAPTAFTFPTIAEVRNADVSESVRSSDLRTLLFANFPIVEIKPMGGTILRWPLQYRAGNFDHSKQEHVAIAGLLFYIERMLIEQRVVRSDDLFFVLKKSKSIPERGIAPHAAP